MKKLIILVTLIVATGLSLPSAKAAGFAVAPPLNPTNMFSQVVSMLVTQGMSLAAATNQANLLAAQGSIAFTQSYSSMRDYFLSQYSYGLVSNVPLAVTGIVLQPGASSGQLYGTNNTSQCASCWQATGYAGNGLWNFSPSNNSMNVQSRLDGVLGLVP